MKQLAQKRPLGFALVVMLILELLVLGGLLLSRIMNIPILALDLPLLLLNAVVAAVLLSWLGWWRVAGFNRPTEWRQLHLLILPLLLLIGPGLIVGVEWPAATSLVPLIVVTLLIGFQEEAIFRGLLLHALKPRGVMATVIISALLFGLIHANSLLVGRDPIFVLAQVVASFLGAIGLGAIRLRTNTVWPLVLLHAVNDFVQFTATGGLEAGDVPLMISLTKIGLSGIMAVYGLYLLRDELFQQRSGGRLGQAVS